MMRWMGYVIRKHPTLSPRFRGNDHVAELAVSERVIISWTSENGIWINGMDLTGAGQRLMMKYVKSAMKFQVSLK